MLNLYDCVQEKQNRIMLLYLPVVSIVLSQFARFQRSELEAKRAVEGGLPALGSLGTMGTLGTMGAGAGVVGAIEDQSSMVGSYASSRPGSMLVDTVSLGNVSFGSSSQRTMLVNPGPQPKLSHVVCSHTLHTPLA